MRLAIITLAALAAAMPAYAQTTLRSALDANAPPFAMPKLDGSIEGMTVDMTNEIAKRLGVEVTIDGMAFSTLLPALQAGTYDFLSVPMFASEERGASFLLTEGIWSISNAFLLQAGGDQVESFDDLRGKVIAVNQGTLDEAYLREREGEYGWTIEAYGSLNDAAQAVQSGRAFASLANDISAIQIAKRNPALMVSDFRDDIGRSLVYSMALGSEDLRVDIENAIECIKADGTAAEIYAEWLGEQPREGTVTVTPQPGYGYEGVPNFDPTEHELICE